MILEYINAFWGENNLFGKFTLISSCLDSVVKYYIRINSIFFLMWVGVKLFVVMLL